MKKLFALSMLIPLAVICSCQRQDAAAEQQLAQRKAELDARETALDEREKALAAREKVAARTTKLATDLQLRSANQNSSGTPVPAPSVPAGLIPTRDTSQLKVERERRIQERLDMREQRLDALRKMRQGMRAQRAQPAPSTQASPNAQAPADAGASGSGETNSPSPSPTP